MSQKQVSDIVKTIEANLRVDAPSFLAENIIHSIQDQIIAEFSSTQLDSATNYKEVQLAVEKKLADARAARLAAAPDKNITITSPADIDKLIREKRKEKNTGTTTNGAGFKGSSNTTYTDDEKEENKNIDQEIKKLKLWKTEGTEWNAAITRLENLVAASTTIVANFANINRFPDTDINTSHNITLGTATARTLPLPAITNSAAPTPTYSITIDGQEISSAATAATYTVNQSGAMYEIRGLRFVPGNPPSLSLAADFAVYQGGNAVPSASFQFDLKADKTVGVTNSTGGVANIVLTSHKPITLKVGSNSFSPALQSPVLSAGTVSTAIDAASQQLYNSQYPTIENAVLDEFIKNNGGDILSDTEKNTLRNRIKGLGPAGGGTAYFPLPIATFQTSCKSLTSPFVDPAFVGDADMFRAKIEAMTEPQMIQTLQTAGFLKTVLDGMIRGTVFTAMRDAVNAMTGSLAMHQRVTALTTVPPAVMGAPAPTATIKVSHIDPVAGPHWLATHAASETAALDAIIRMYAPGVTFTPADRASLEADLRAVTGLVPTRTDYEDACCTDRSPLIAGAIRGTPATLQAAIMAGTGERTPDAMRTKLQNFLQTEISNNAVEAGRVTAISTLMTAAINRHNAATTQLDRTGREAALADPSVLPRITPLAQTVFAGVPDPIGAAIDEYINTHVGTSTLDKAALRNTLRTYLTGLTPPFAFDAAAFTAAAVGPRSPLVPDTFTGNQAMLTALIATGTNPDGTVAADRTPTAIQTKLRPFVLSAIAQQLDDPTAVWNTPTGTPPVAPLIGRVSAALAAHNTTTLPLARANQHAAITTAPHDFTPRITNTLRVTYRANGEYIAALRSQLTAMINAHGANALTEEQRTRTVDNLLPQVLAITGGAPVITENDLATQFLDPAAAMHSPLYDDAFVGTDRAFRDRVTGLLNQTDPAQPSIPAMGRTFLRGRIDAWLQNNLATLVPGTAFDFQTVVQNAVNTTLGTHVDTAHNLLTSTTGPLSATLLRQYVHNRGNYFPAQDEAARRYRGMRMIRNFRRRRDGRSNRGHDIKQERVTSVAGNSYMTFFEQVNTTAQPETIQHVALPSGLGEVDISAAVEYFPGQNSLAQNGQVTINVAGSQVNVGPFPPISNGFGLHGIIETILRQNFHADAAVNNVIATNAVIAVYKTLVRTAQEKFGALRVGTQSITLNGNGNLVYTNTAAPTTNCSEQTLRDSNDYATFATALPHLARGFHEIMSARNADYIAGVAHNQIATPTIRNPLSRRRYRRLLAEPLEFTVAGITGTYTRAGQMHLTFQSPEGEEVVLEGAMETVFSSPMLYGKQHEILEGLYRSFAARVMTSRRANRSAGFYCVHDGRTYAIINRGTPVAPQLVYGEIPAAVAGGAGAYGFAGSGRLPRNMVNTITPTNERTMLSNPDLMNSLISVMTGGV